MSDSAAFDRQARALEQIERNTHEMVKIFTDISNAMLDIAVILKEAFEAKEVTDAKE